MDLPKCRTCGERHRLGVCPATTAKASGFFAGLSAEQKKQALEYRGDEAIGGEAKKRGRPRIGEIREKPWLTSVPPMSERTWYRRKREGNQP
jgi:hypothetical protein